MVSLSRIERAVLAAAGGAPVVNDSTPAPKTPVPPSSVTVVGASAATTAAVAAGRHVMVANNNGCPALPATGPPVSASANPAPVVMKTPVALGNADVAMA